MTLALDLDGTLITCEPRQMAVLRGALAACGVGVDISAVWACKREGATTLQALLQVGLAEGAARRVATLWERMVEDPQWLALDSLLAGVEATLADMRRAGYRLWLLTARRQREWLLPQLVRLGLVPLFDRVCVVSPAQATSAKADLLREAAVEAFFGDTESDGRAAAAAGVAFRGVATGMRSVGYLQRNGMTPVYPDLRTAWTTRPELCDARNRLPAK